MTMRAETITGEPIIVIHLSSPLKLPDDPMSANRAVAEFKHKIGGKVYRVMDFTAVTGFTFSQLTMGMAEDSIPGVEGGGADPDVMSAFCAQANLLVELGVNSYNTQQQYHMPGNVKLFGTVDEALAYVRAEITKK